MKIKKSILLYIILININSASLNLKKELTPPNFRKKLLFLSLGSLVTAGIIWKIYKYFKKNNSDDLKNQSRGDQSKDDHQDDSDNDDKPSNLKNNQYKKNDSDTSSNNLWTHQIFINGKEVKDEDIKKTKKKIKDIYKEIKSNTKKNPDGSYTASFNWSWYSKKK